MLKFTATEKKIQRDQETADKCKMVIYTLRKNIMTENNLLKKELS